ncbi:MAG: S1C family serine protease [Parvibaculaceae bacterium]
MKAHHWLLAGASALGLLMLATCARAQEAKGWDIASMNRLIDQTNFIVDDKCSGTLISIEHRLILTNHHCVASRISSREVEETSENGEVRKVRRERFEDVPVAQNHYAGFAKVGSTSYDTEIVGYDRSTDLAVIQIKQREIPFTLAPPMADPANVVRGERVWIVGNPMMLEATVVEGVVSSLHRQLEVGGDDKRDYIQYSGGTFGGNSGGALYNDRGELIGVPAASSRAATFLGFAVPVGHVKALLSRNCFASVHDRSAPAHDACKADKARRTQGKEAAR